jgi:hypothetical protein
MWSEWFLHDGNGCPVPAGTFVAITRRWYNGDERTAEALLTPALVEHPSWFMPDEFGPYTCVVRYRIRRPDALQAMIDRAAALDIKPRVDA